MTLDEKTIDEEIARLREKRSIQMERVRKSKLDPFRRDLVALRQHGAHFAEIQLWLKEHGVSITISTLQVYIKNHSQTVEA